MSPKKLWPVAAVAAIICNVHAQNADQPAIRDTDESDLETIVVTGVAAQQLRQDAGDSLRLARRNRHVVDHGISFGSSG
jgi:hypothetical protein